MEERGRSTWGWGRWVGGEMFILLCGENEFPVTTEKGKRITDLYPHNYDHHQTTLAITNGGEEDTKHNEGLEGGRGWGVVVGWWEETEIHYVVPTSFISTRSRDGAPGVPALDQRALLFSPLLCESALRCEPGPKRRSI